jgi:hypothetical protein
MTLSITTLCHYAKCRIFIVTLNAIMLNVVVPSVVAPFLILSYHDFPLFRFMLAAVADSAEPAAAAAAVARAA